MDIIRKKLLKKICTISLTAAVLTGGAAVASQVGFVQTGISVNAADTLTSGDFEYEVEEDNTVTITRYVGSDTEVTIPSKIAGKPVTFIGYDAFYDCESLTSVTIPDSVTSIGDGAFCICEGLTSITIPDSVTSIGYCAFQSCTGLTSITIPNSVTSINDAVFYNCTGLTSITIPNSVTSINDAVFYNCTGLTDITIPDSVISIGSDAFSGCTGLTSVTIPDSVTSIGSYVFSGCTGLTSINVNKNNTEYSSDNGVLLNKDKTQIICCPGGKTGKYIITDSVISIGDSAFDSCTGLKSITISDNVTSIGDFAFSGCTGLTSINVNKNNTEYSSDNGVLLNKDKTQIICCPGGKTGKYVITDSVTSIGNWAFANCTGLTSITIPNSVTSIDSGAFYGCIGLTSIVIPDSVTSINNYAFENCTGLASITIPNSVTSIKSGAFYGCTGLTSIIIPDSVTSIDRIVFYNCISLTNIAIPNSVTSIGDHAFYNCTSLTSINVNENNTEYSSDNGVLLNKDKTQIICCPGGKTGKYVISDSVTSIDEFAFSGCTGLVSIIIPDSVTSISFGAFSDCTCLTSIIIPASVTSISDAFRGCDNLTIYGKKGSYAEQYANDKNIKFEELVPPLENTCSVSAESIVLGNKITLNGAAENGKAPYTYAYYYKKTTDKKWVTAKGFSDTTSVSIKPAMAKDYDICIKVKDADGKVEKKYFTVKVNEKLAIKASVSAENLKLGNKLTLTGAAAGGSGDYTYAYYYKKTTDKKWVTAKGFSNTTSVSIKPAMAKDYEVCIKVKDSTGATQKQYFTVKVTA